jgi:hypothetical protein
LNSGFSRHQKALPLALTERFGHFHGSMTVDAGDANHDIRPADDPSQPVGSIARATVMIEVFPSQFLDHAPIFGHGFLRPPHNSDFLFFKGTPGTTCTGSRAFQVAATHQSAFFARRFVHRACLLTGANFHGCPIDFLAKGTAVLGFLMSHIL